MIALETSEKTTSTFRKDLENSVYTTWRDTPSGEQLKDEAFEHLRLLLVAHARAVMYSILRRNEDSLVNEAVDRVLMNLDSFRGEVLFTTWAHRILMSAMYDQRRLDRKRKETPFNIDLPGTSRIGDIDIIMTVSKLLNGQDFDLFEALVLQGMTQREAAQSLHVPKSEVARKWLRIAGELRNAFGK